MLLPGLINCLYLACNMKPVELDSKNFDKVVQENEKVIVDIWAEWCVPCKMMSPIFEELAKEYPEIVYLQS